MEPDDWPGVWSILRPIFRAGETYAHTAPKKRNRRTPEQIVADMEAKIAEVKERAAVFRRKGRDSVAGWKRSGRSV